MQNSEFRLALLLPALCLQVAEDVVPSRLGSQGDRDEIGHDDTPDPKLFQTGTLPSTSHCGCASGQLLPALP